MNFFTISQIINFLSCFGIGTIVLLRSPKSSIHRAFVYFCGSVMLWSFGYIMWQLSPDYERALFWARFLMSGAALAPMSYFIFAIRFLKLDQQTIWRSVIWIVCALNAVIIILNSTTGLLVNSLAPKMVFKYWLIQGEIFLPFLAIFFGQFIAATYLLIRQCRRETGFIRLQIAYICLGIFIAFIGGSTNYFPFFDIPILPYGTPFVTAYPLLVGYAITRYRFFDIRVVLKKSVIYGFFVFASVLIFVVLFWWLSKLLSSSFVIIAAISLIIMFQQKYKEKLKSLIDRAFFFNELDLSKRVSEKVKMVSSTHDLETFVLEVVAGLQDAVKAEVREVYIAEREHHRFKSYYPKNSKNFIGFNDEFINLLHEQDDYIIIAEELAEQKDDEKSRDLLKWLRKQKAGMLIIISRGGDLTGIIFLGKKIGGAFELYDIRRIKKIIRAARENLPTVLYWHSTLENLKRHLHEEAYKQDE